MIFNTAPADISEETKAIIGSYNRTTEQEYEDEKQEKPHSAKKTTVNNVILDDDTGEIIDAKVEDNPVAEQEEVNETPETSNKEE